MHASVGRSGCRGDEHGLKLLMDSYVEQRSLLEGGKSTPAHLVSIAPPSGELQLSYMGMTVLFFNTL